MVVAYSLAPSSAFAIVLRQSNGTLTQLPGMTSPPNPLPQPIAKELVPGTPMYGVALPALSAHTTYAVQYRDVVSYCGRTFTNYYAMGPFTTK